MTDIAATSHEARRTIPRMAGHPVLGHLRDFSSDRVALQLRVMREQPDIAMLRLGFIPTVAITSPALAQEVLVSKASSFVKSPGLSIFMRPVLGNGLLTSERDFHAKQRRLLAPVFAHKRITSYATEMAARSAKYASTVSDGATVDVSEDMMRLTLSIVGKTLFDTEVAQDSDEVGEALTVAMETAMAQLGSLVPVPPIVPTPTNLRNRRAVARLDAIIYRIIRARRREGDRGDLLSMLLAARDEDGRGMSDVQIRDEAMTLFLAGHETTANALAWTLYLLAKNPDARARVEAEVDALGREPSYADLEHLPYTLAVAKEAMRIYPPAYILARRSTEDVTLGKGHFLKKGTILFVNVIGIHRRPDLFPDPERFDPMRFFGDAERSLPRCAYMPFGAGPRICIGNHFALMEEHVVLASILRRLRFDLVSPAPPAMEPLVTLRPRGGLAMRVTVRQPSA